METSPFPRLFVLDFLSDEEKATLRASERRDDDQVHQCPLAAAEAADAAAAAADTAQAEVIFCFTLQHRIIRSVLYGLCCNKCEPISRMFSVIRK